MTASLSYIRSPLWDYINDGSPYEPFDWQIEHIHSKVDEGFRFIIGSCGRRSGKTFSMRAEVVRAAFQPPEVVDGVTHHPVIYIIGPTAELAERIFDPMWQLFVPDVRQEQMPPLGEFYLNHDKNRGIIWLKTGAVIKKRTADDPRSLQGERVTAAFVEESQDMNEEAWKALLPALLDAKGRLFCIGVPWGRNRFRTFYDLGQNKEPGYYSFGVPTSANPNNTDSMIKEMAASLTDIEYRAHIMAEWVDEYGAVFKNPERIFNPMRQHAGPYFMGLDIGQMQDFTVAYVIDIPTLQVVDRERMQAIDYVSQMERIASLAKKWNARSVNMDVTGAGRGPADLLISMGVPVSEYNFTSGSKQELISTLIRAVEKGMVNAMPDDHVLLGEMKMFEGKVVSTAGGTRVDYSHPPGGHDDAVIALALAVMKAMPYHMVTGKSPDRGKYVNLTKSKRKHPLAAIMQEARRNAVLEGVA